MFHRIPEAWRKIPSILVNMRGISLSNCLIYSSVIAVEVRSLEKDSTLSMVPTHFVEANLEMQ